LVEIGILHKRMKTLETRIEAAKPLQSDDLSANIGQYVT